MGLEDIMLNEISQTEKDKYCMKSLICGLVKKEKETTSKYSQKEANSQIQRIN